MYSDRHVDDDLGIRVIRSIGCDGGGGRDRSLNSPYVCHTYIYIYIYVWGTVFTRVIIGMHIRIIIESRVIIRYRYIYIPVLEALSATAFLGLLGLLELLGLTGTGRDELRVSLSLSLSLCLLGLLGLLARLEARAVLEPCPPIYIYTYNRRVIILYQVLLKGYLRVIQGLFKGYSRAIQELYSKGG